MYRRQSLAAVAIALAFGTIGMAPQEASARRHRVCGPPPIEVTLCVDDPCDCCAPQSVCVSWRNGFLGRRVATYSWPCCGHTVEVVVTRRGELIVR
jgi:hypothetical protein